MPHCCQSEEDIISCEEEITDHDESSHPSCTLLFLGSTIVAYSIYQTAEWLIKEQQEWFRRRRLEPSQSSPSPNYLAKQPPREKASKVASCLRNCMRWIHSHRPRCSRGLGTLQPESEPPPHKTRVSFYQRLAQGGCCCFATGEEEQGQEIDELHDQSREMVVDREGGQDGEVTIIHFEQKDGDAQLCTAAEEPRQAPRRRKSAAQLQRERIRKARAQKRWEETVDLSFRRVVYTIAGGTIVALTMFSGRTTRWSVIALGAGLGLGSALRDSAYILAEGD